jgi:hypothetical protein
VLIAPRVEHCFKYLIIRKATFDAPNLILNMFQQPTSITKQERVAVHKQPTLLILCFISYSNIPACVHIYAVARNLKRSVLLLCFLTIWSGGSCDGFGRSITLKLMRLSISISISNRASNDLCRFQSRFQCRF